jgi:hypothetical protein
MVAWNSVQVGRNAGDDCQIVRIGKRWHDATAAGVDTSASKHSGERRHQPARERIVQIARIATIDGEHHRRLTGQRVASSIDQQRGIVHATIVRSRRLPSE